MTDILSRAVSVSLTTGGVGKPKLTVEESMRVYRAAAQQGLLGNYYGYPQCCVDHFKTSRFTADTDKNEVEFGFFGTGFRICPECLANRKLSDVYRQICSQRICHMPFPLAADDDPEDLGFSFCSTIIQLIEKLEAEGTKPDPRLIANYRRWMKVVEEAKEKAIYEPFDEWPASI